MLYQLKLNIPILFLYFNLIKINTGPLIQEFSKHFKMMIFNFQSVRKKALDICDYIMQANVDLVFQCETWLRREGDESDCAALTLLGFCLKSFPRQSCTGDGLALFFTSNQSYKKIAVSSRNCVLTGFEICGVCISHDHQTAVFVSVYRPPPPPPPPPHLVDRTS